MNENLNLVEILKDCPKGYKLYSPLFGEVEFKEIRSDETYQILTSYDYDGIKESQARFTKEGFYYTGLDVECLLFPSKDQRDWSKFNAPWYKKLVEPKFKVGDWIISSVLGTARIIGVNDSNEYKLEYIDSKQKFSSIDYVNYAYDKWTIQDAKDGDVLADEDNNIGIFQECEGMYWYSYTYLGCDGQLRGFSMGGSHEQTDTHPATKEQRDLLFQKIKEAGYKWNEETKTFEKLVEPKFKVGDKIVNVFMRYRGTLGTIFEITDDKYIFTDGRYILISNQDSWDLVSNRFDRKTLDDEMIKTAILNHLKKMWGNCQDDVCGVHVEDAINWLEKQKDKDKLIQELGEYKVKYTQEVLEKHINNISNKDDERLRKTAIAFLKDFAEQGYENAVECIDWLEKQGEQEEPQVYETEDGKIITYSETDGYKFVEPNFHEGDWVVNKFGDSWHIDSLDKKNYQVSDGKGNYNYFPISKQDEMHLWNIQDAKDGDVLACKEEILLLKSYSVQERISLYCWYNGQTNNFHSKEEIDISLNKRNKIFPATKEQSYLLFQKIKEAGYKWNYETKTLEKLVKPKFKVIG